MYWLGEKTKIFGLLHRTCSHNFCLLLIEPDLQMEKIIIKVNISNTCLTWAPQRPDYEDFLRVLVRDLPLSLPLWGLLFPFLPPQPDRPGGCPCHQTEVRFNFSPLRKRYHFLWPIPWSQPSSCDWPSPRVIHNLESGLVLTPDVFLRQGETCCEERQSLYHP